MENFTKQHLDYLEEHADLIASEVVNFKADIATARTAKSASEQSDSLKSMRKRVNEISHTHEYLDNDLGDEED